MFPKNCWYVVANIEDVKTTKPFAVKVADICIILYRDTDNKIVAMDDKCAHRLAPLSLGRIEGNDIRCMYHGIKFGSDGTCKEVPGQDMVPKSFCIKTHAVRELNEWVWLWLGTEESADDSLLPDAFPQNSDIYQIRKGSIQYTANYQLLNDNLCDFSHVAYVHEKTLGSTSEDKYATSTPTLEFLDRGVYITRWVENTPSHEDPSIFYDSWMSYKYLLPGILIMDSQFHPIGAARKFAMGAPERAKAISQVCSMQGVSPIDDTNLQYFYSLSIPKEEPETRLDLTFGVTAAAFLEDKVMLEAQQKIILANPEDRLSATIHDKAGAHFRKLIKKAAT